MNTDFTLLPEQASATAGPIDHLAGFILGICVFFSTLTAILLVYFAIRYRRRTESYVPPHIEGAKRIEFGWIGFMGGLTLIMFFWAMYLYLDLARPPDDALEVYVVGKQWMWKVQHPDGQREIDELHVPVGKPVRLILTSEDVIHDFYVPAFRVKQDVLPGRYTYLWFEAKQEGAYNLFCAEYCGTDHSRMVGKVYAMRLEAYGDWLSKKADLSMALRGRQLFLKHQCVACHTGDTHQRAPSLEDLYLSTVTLQDGSQFVASDNYLAESIRLPKAKIVAGFQPIMPTFGPDVMSEMELQQLIAFIKGLHRGQTPKRNEETPPPETDKPPP
jgi:cytochrome c oxidase subunit II